MVDDYKEHEDNQVVGTDHSAIGSQELGNIIKVVSSALTQDTKLNVWEGEDVKDSLNLVERHKAGYCHR